MGFDLTTLNQNNIQRKASPFIWDTYLENLANTAAIIDQTGPQVSGAWLQSSRCWTCVVNKGSTGRSIFGIGSWIPTDSPYSQLGKRDGASMNYSCEVLQLSPWHQLQSTRHLMRSTIYVNIKMSRSSYACSLRRNSRLVRVELWRINSTIGFTTASVQSTTNRNHQSPNPWINLFCRNLLKWDFWESSWVSVLQLLST